MRTLPAVHILRLVRLPRPVTQRRPLQSETQTSEVRHENGGTSTYIWRAAAKTFTPTRVEAWQLHKAVIHIHTRSGMSECIHVAVDGHHLMPV